MANRKAPFDTQPHLAIPPFQCPPPFYAVLAVAGFPHRFHMQRHLSELASTFNVGVGIARLAPPALACNVARLNRTKLAAIPSISEVCSIFDFQRGSSNLALSERYPNPH